jgi:hypothetical protein
VDKPRSYFRLTYVDHALEILWADLLNEDRRDSNSAVDALLM